MTSVGMHVRERVRSDNVKMQLSLRIRGLELSFKELLLVFGFDEFAENVKLESLVRN